MWIIKAVYPAGSHKVMLNEEPLKFESKQDAEARAEILNRTTKDMASRNMRTNNVSYMVVEDHL